MMGGGGSGRCQLARVVAGGAVSCFSPPLSVFLVLPRSLVVVLSPTSLLEPPSVSLSLAHTRSAEQSHMAEEMAALRMRSFEPNPR
ncbi:hypothetical protein CDD83_9988 [Cordyceps sp. RAO-2017]|nr:hypothetical protein CDD83_9988 [Cordyceps sp. RAO-2017]